MEREGGREELETAIAPSLLFSLWGKSLLAGERESLFVCVILVRVRRKEGL